MKKTIIYLSVVILGVGCVALGLLLTPHFIAARLTTDGVIDPAYLPIIRMYRLAGMAGGAALLALCAAVRAFEKPVFTWVGAHIYFDESRDRAPGAGRDLFLISALALFFEVMMLRWVPSEFRIFAFFKNLILMSCLFGFGLGFAVARRRTNLFSIFPIMVSLFAILIIIGSHRIFLMINYPDMGRQHIWEVETTASQALSALLFYASVTFIFIFNMLLFVAPGQLMGRLMARLPALRAYSINVAGSLCGVAAFSLMAYLELPPWAWFAAGGALCLWFFRRRPAWAALNMLFLALALMFFFQDRNLDIRWTPYYKLQTVPLMLNDSRGRPHNQGWSHFVNGASFIHTLDLDRKQLPEYMAVYDNRYNLPYRIKPHPRDVLIVGAGTGNNAAAALRHGAGRIDAVEIDPGILRLGKEIHPEHPYQNPRVHVHINDARNYFRNTNKKYDLIVFGLLDSHTMFSSMSSIRLDNFVYTMESFEQLKALLKPDGVVFMQFAVGREWIGDRICEMLTRVFGKEPLNTSYGAFVTGPGLDRARWSKDPYMAAPRYHAGRVRPATDDWPYLYLAAPGIPASYIKTLALILTLCVGLLLALSPETRRPRLHFFFLGAGFLLIEFKSMTEAALLFGSTWIVNAAVISGILIMILAANAWCARRERTPETAAYALLFAAIALNYFFPVQHLLGGAGYLVQSLAAGLFLALPLLFAGVIFAGSVKQTARIELAFSSNLLGAVAGGVLEYASLAVGIRQLYIIAAALYLLSWIFKKSR